MKRVIRASYQLNGGTENLEDIMLPAELVTQMLSQIDELRGKAIRLNGTSDGAIQLQVGDWVYRYDGILSNC